MQPDITAYFDEEVVLDPTKDRSSSLKALSSTTEEQLSYSPTLSLREISIFDRVVRDQFTDAVKKRTESWLESQPEEVRAGSWKGQEEYKQQLAAAEKSKAIAKRRKHAHDEHDSRAHDTGA